jgi:pimeloyl-ACP methyl ester carboxylesterase
VPTNGRATAADGAEVDRFVELQARLLDFYGVRAESRFVDLATPRMRAHVLDAGAGEPLLVFHGGDGEAVTWAPLMGPLQAHARVVAVDRPGFGLSDAFDYRRGDLRAHAADFVSSLLDALELDSATLVGGSMGGFFALSAALAHPDRVRGLVLVGFAAGTTKEMGTAMQTLCGTPGMAERFMQGRDTMEAQQSQYRELFGIDPATVSKLYFATRIAGLRLPAEQGTWATLLPRLSSLAGTRPEVYLVAELPSVRPPTLVLWGEHDLAPAEVGRAITTRIPRGRFEYLPGVGHFPFLEAPDRCARLIAAFLREPR